MVDEPLLEACRDAGYPVLVYTLNQLADAQRLKTLGAAGFHRSTGLDYRLQA